MAQENDVSFRTGCVDCGKNTAHNVVASYEEDPPNEYDYHAKLKYMIIKCNGCGYVSFRHEFHDYETMRYDEFGNVTHSIKIDEYPRFIVGHKSLDYSGSLPALVKAVYEETVDAITQENYILAGIGLRAIIEAITKEEEMPGRDLSVKIRGFVRNGYLSKKDADRLHAIRFMGNDAAHELKAYRSDQVLLGLEIIEHILKTLYLFDFRSAYALEMPVSSYEEFESLLSNRCQSSEESLEGKSVTIKSILGKSMRRVVGGLDDYEAELIRRIQSGAYKILKIAKIEAKEELATTYYELAETQDNKVAALAPA